MLISIWTLGCSLVLFVFLHRIDVVASHQQL